MFRVFWGGLGTGFVMVLWEIVGFVSELGLWKGGWNACLGEGGWGRWGVVVFKFREDRLLGCLKRCQGHFEEGGRGFSMDVI